MVVAICRLELFLLDQPNTLKEKRQVVRRIVERIRARFGVSIAEVGENELYQRAALGIAYVTKESGDADRVINHVLNYIEKDGMAEITERLVELQHF